GALRGSSPFSYEAHLAPGSGGDDPHPRRPGKSEGVPMDHDSYPDDFLRQILTEARIIAVVGASPRARRPSHGVMRYLQQRGYRAIPVNPFAAGDKILGETCYAKLADVPEAVDMVDIFRRPEMAGGVVDEAIAICASSVWMQLGVRDDPGAA